MNEYSILAVLILIALTASWVAILALWNRKEYYRHLAGRFHCTNLSYGDTIQKNAKRITELKNRLGFYKSIIDGQKDVLEKAQAAGKEDLDTIAQLQEAIRDLETVIGMKDEEIEGLERGAAVQGRRGEVLAGPAFSSDQSPNLHEARDEIVRESTKLVDSLRVVVLEKCRELKILKAFLVQHGIDPSFAQGWQEADIRIEGAPHFSQISEPDPENYREGRDACADKNVCDPGNRPEIEGCEVCEAEQPESPALWCETTDAAVGC